MTTITLDRSGPIATLTLNRPESLNALDFTMVDALVDAAGVIAADDHLRVVVVRGAGKHFMAGGDVRSFATELGRPPEECSARFHDLIARLHAAIERLAAMPHTLIAQVHGAVAGFGLSLMNACDLVIAADNAYFAAAYKAIGTTPDGGGTWSLPRLVGMRRALEIMLVGDRFDAAQALAWGLVNRVVPAADLDATVDKLAHDLARGPAQALRNTRRLLRDAANRTLAEQLAAEAASFAACAASDDFAEGVTAFLEKRPARFGDAS